MNNLITIIIPTFNNQTTIHKHLQSILNQTYQNIEILIVDSFSTDSTIKIAKQYAIEDKRIQIIQNTYENEIKAYIHGVKKARGKYVFISSPLTVLSLNYIEYSISQIKNHDIFSCNYKTISEEKLQKDYLIKITQPDEKNIIYTNTEYMNTLHTTNCMNFDSIFSLHNKLILKSIINTNYENSNIFFFFEDILLNAKSILESNQTLILKFEIDKHFNDICFNNNDFDKINFLEHLLLKSKKENSNLIVPIQLLLSEILRIRIKLFFPYLEIEEKDNFIHILDSKFSSIYKFCNHKKISSSGIQKLFDKYEKLLKKEKAIQASPYLYPY